MIRIILVCIIAFGLIGCDDYKQHAIVLPSVKALHPWGCEKHGPAIISTPVTYALLTDKATKENQDTHGLSKLLVDNVTYYNGMSVVCQDGVRIIVP